MPLDTQTQQALQDASLPPPVTKDTLHELDLSWIMHNTSLRIDVNFDHDLHFIPITGVKAEEKRRTAQLYWIALTVELQIYLHNAQICQECLHREECQRFDFPCRLPEMFITVRNLLETLVPDRDHDQVAEHLDVPFLIQQVEHGVFDAAGMSRWLASLLTCHCAPMRDEWAKEMSHMIERGATDTSMRTLVQGLEKLFTFLEAMKLDVANHQIRTLKYVLIDDTIPYQLDYFGQKVNSGRLDLTQARDWYISATQDHRERPLSTFCAQSSSPFAYFMHGLVQLCNPPSEHGSQELPGFPLTLRYDQERIRRLQLDIQDLAYLELCQHVFEESASQLGYLSQITPQSRQDLRSRLLTIIDCEGSVEDVAATWKTHASAIATEITAHCFRTRPRSVCMIPNEKFIAVAKHLNEAFRTGLADTIKDLLSEVEEMAWCYTQSFMHMSTRDISEKQRIWQQARPSVTHGRDSPDKDDIARKLAHIGTLHWQVWESLAYRPALEESGYQDSLEESWESLRRFSNDGEYDTGLALTAEHGTSYTDARHGGSMGKHGDKDLLESREDSTFNHNV